jgi:hypothetical protein
MHMSFDFLQEFVDVPVVLERAAPLADEIQQVGAIKVLPIGHLWPAVPDVFIIIGSHTGETELDLYW